MARMPRWCALLVGCAALSWPLAASGPAEAAPGGAVLSWRYTGWLGKSGMYVQSTPQSLLVLRVARQSPADVAGIAGPAPRPANLPKGNPTEPEVLRILAINGRAPSEMTSKDLLAAFKPGQAARVAVVLGRRGPADLIESREGPVLVDLMPPATARAYQHAAARRWKLALEAAGGNAAIRSAVVARMLFDAQQQALDGDMAQALKTLALVPRDDPGHDRAVELSRQYERVTRQARRPG